MTTKHSCEIKTLHDVELLSSYKNVIEFLKFKSYVGVQGKNAMGRSHTLNNTTTFPVYVLYKTYIYLLNLLKVSKLHSPNALPQV